jgi:hypothetical protein
MASNYRLDLVDPNQISADIRRATMKKIARIVAPHARAEAPVGERKPPFKKVTAPKRRLGSRLKTAITGIAPPAPKARRRMRLKASIRTQVTNGGLEAAVAAVSRHAHLVIKGTKAHRIPRRGKHPLSINGQPVGRDAVSHPGTQPNDFLTRAAEMSRDEIAAALKDSI